MKEELKYKVVYKDGQRTRVKDLVFIKKEGPLLMFTNEMNKKEEVINENNIIRIEGK